MINKEINTKLLTIFLKKLQLLKCVSGKLNAKKPQINWLVVFYFQNYTILVNLNKKLKQLSITYNNIYKRLPRNQNLGNRGYFKVFLKNIQNSRKEVRTNTLETFFNKPTSLLMSRMGAKFRFTNTGVKKFKKKYFNYMNNFFLNFLHFFFKLKVFLSFKKILTKGQYVEKLPNHHKNILKIKKYTKRLKSYRFLNSLYKILWISLKMKDSNFFLKWFCYRVELLFFKLHKNIPYLINTIFKQFHKKLFKQTNTKGIYFSLRGKIGVTGDSKKKHVYVKYGKHSSSSKELRLSISKSQIKTKTGVMGVNFNIFF